MWTFEAYYSPNDHIRYEKYEITLRHWFMDDSLSVRDRYTEHRAPRNWTVS